jgi:hypothetical protein
VTKLQRVVKVPVYWVIVGVMVMFASPVAALVGSVKINNANTARQLASQQKAQVEAEAARVQAEAAAKAEALRITCAFFGSSLDVYIETPPQTPAGKAQQANYLELYTLAGCQPPRRK